MHIDDRGGGDGNFEKFQGGGSKIIISEEVNPKRGEGGKNFVIVSFQNTSNVIHVKGKLFPVSCKRSIAFFLLNMTHKLEMKSVSIFHP